ncbi:MAG: serine hydrolase [Tissierellia bacterium]|nr:serine hydrolase [Tissierellia bacterium]
MKKNKRKKKVNYLSMVLGLVILAIVFLTIKFIWQKIRPKDDFIYSFKERHQVSSAYLRRMDHVNQNFIMDNNYEIGEKYIEKNFYRWNDESQMTFDKNLTLTLKAYLSDHKIKSEDISISIISSEYGDRFGHNDRVVRNYYDIDKLLVNMSVMKMIDDQRISLNDKISVLKGDLSEESNYFSKKSVGLTYNIKEIMALSLSRNDLTAKNMLKRYIIEKSNMKFDAFLRREFNLNMVNEKASTIEIINIAREMKKYKEIYRDVTAEMPDKKEVSDFLKYIVNDDHQNYYKESQNSYYDIGYVRGASQYIYSIYIENMEAKTINEIGDLLDRKINEHFLLKNT